MERRLVQSAGHGFHEGEVRAARHVLRHLPGRHRLDGAAGPGGARRAAGAGAGGRAPRRSPRRHGPRPVCRGPLVRADQLARADELAVLGG